MSISAKSCFKKFYHAFNLRDDKYSAFIEQYQAHTRLEKLLYILLHLTPGFAAYVLIYHARIPAMHILGISSLTFQVIVLLTIALGWHIGFPFYVLMKKDGLSFSESLYYLGLTTRLDVKGLLTVVPIVTLLFTIVSAPYIYFVHPRLYDLLNAIPFFTIEDWHIYTLGYGYDFFPWPLLLVAFIANFLGEELYFRGFLLNKIRSIQGNSLISNVLFQMYHIWQVPLNWAFAPMFFLIPYPFLVKLRKNIYGSILFHMFINLAWYEVLFVLFGSYPE